MDKITHEVRLTRWTRLVEQCQSRPRGTDHRPIRELEKIEMVRRNNGHYRLDHAITKTQKTILSSFGLDDEDVLDTAASISSLLSKGQPALTDIDEDNNPDETEDDFYGEDEIYFRD